jgi:RNA polymerase subunit RPABC4/transcription elongation factor Spt4
MSLAKCRACGGQVAASAKTCPHCGAPDPEVSEFVANWLFWIVVPIVALAALGFFSCRKSDDTRPPAARQTAPAAPPPVQGVEATWDTGLRTHDLVLTHRHNEGVLPKYTGLLDVDLTVTLYRQDGTMQQVRQSWAEWSKGEAKRVNVPAHKYQKVELSGTCRAAAPAPKATAGGGLDPGVEVQTHVFQNSWTWDWNRR